MTDCCESHETQSIRATDPELAARLISQAYGDGGKEHRIIRGASLISVSALLALGSCFSISAAFQKRFSAFLRLIARYASFSRSDAASLAFLSMASLSLSQLQAFPWIACDRASLRPCDLADGFLGAADTIADLLKLPRPDGFAPAGLSSSSLRLLQELAADCSSPVASPASEEALEALEELSEWLSSRAPSGFFFGASEGDGSLFGFWPSEEALEALEAADFLNDDPSIQAFFLQSAEEAGLELSGIGDGFRGEAEGLTEEAAGAFFAQDLAEELGAVDFQKLSWPLTCVDWEQAWKELSMGDGFSASPSHKFGLFWIFQAS